MPHNFIFDNNAACLWFVLAVTSRFSKFGDARKTKLLDDLSSNCDKVIWRSWWFSCFQTIIDHSMRQLLQQHRLASNLSPKRRASAVSGWYSHSTGCLERFKPPHSNANNELRTRLNQWNGKTCATFLMDILVRTISFFVRPKLKFIVQVPTSSWTDGGGMSPKSMHRWNAQSLQSHENRCGVSCARLASIAPGRVNSLPSLSSNFTLRRNRFKRRIADSTYTCDFSGTPICLDIYKQLVPAKSSLSHCHLSGASKFVHFCSSHRRHRWQLRWISWYRREILFHETRRRLHIALRLEQTKSQAPRLSSLVTFAGRLVVLTLRFRNEENYRDFKNFVCTVSESEGIMAFEQMSACMFVNLSWPCITEASVHGNANYYDNKHNNCVSHLQVHNQWVRCLSYLA